MNSRVPWATILRTIFSYLIGAVPLVTMANPSGPPGLVILGNPLFRYVITPAAQNIAFEDRRTGLNYLKTNNPSVCAWVRLAGQDHPATAAALNEGRLRLGFGETGVRVVVKVEAQAACLVLTVESITGGEVEALTFLHIPLTLQGTPNESFGASTLSLNLHTRVDALPALQTELRASGVNTYGLIGAKTALVAAPMDRMLPMLQQALSGASELPVCKVAGPWAHEIPFNHGSYLFNFGSLTETNVDDWIEMTRSLGFTQIDNHGGGAFFRFGDLELNRAQWPDGWDSWKRIVARLHAANVGSILHTYAFFIDKKSKYVTPVPDPRLDAFRTFTLADPLTAEAAEIRVVESTAGLSTVTGFFEHNSVVLHLGDELVTFGGVSQEAPWRFTGVKRGQWGTQAAPHDRTTRVRHLKECFGLFVPNPESTLFEEIAANHAEVVNRCGFDGVYLDAIDGSSILRGGDACWYWANKFVVEIQKRLAKPVGMEMSAMWHHFWQYRTRWQAWDYPQRGHRRFIDLHAASVNGGLLLPLHLGWWNFQAFDPPQIEPVFPEVMEQLGARLIGWDAGISLTSGVDREKLRRTPLFRRAADILRQCEELRHTQAFDTTIKAKLREPGQEFALCQDPTGRSRFRRVQSHPHVLTPGEPWTLSWSVTNAFADQPIRFRLEALISVAPPETNRWVLADLAAADRESWQCTSADGVKSSLEPVSDRAGSRCGLTVSHSGKVPQTGAWIRWTKRFNPPLDLKGRQGLQVDVEGDGSGAVLAIRLESPPHLAYGAVADRYLPVDFTGRRSVTLVETESARWSDYIWNDGKSLYNVYRETINFGAIESASLWLQNLPPNREIKIRIGPVQAVPLRPVSVKNPQLRVAGQTLEFPIELAPGSWIEGNGPDDCQVFGATGEPLGRLTPRGPWPRLRAGFNGVEFSCPSEPVGQPRAKITVFTQGEIL